MADPIDNPKSKTCAERSRSIQNVALVFLLILYLAIALAHAFLAPLTTGPDELAHYEYVRFIADQGRLPQTIAEREQASYKSDQPPLYHLLAAVPAALVDPSGPPYLKRVGDHPRRQLIERTRHFWGLYNTEDERWPFRAEILRWQIGRWVAILFGAATVAATFFMGREVFGIFSRSGSPSPQPQGREDKDPSPQPSPQGRGSKDASPPLGGIEGGVFAPQKPTKIHPSFHLATRSHCRRHRRLHPPLRPDRFNA